MCRKTRDVDISPPDKQEEYPRLSKYRHFDLDEDEYKAFKLGDETRGWAAGRQLPTLPESGWSEFSRLLVRKKNTDGPDLNSKDAAAVQSFDLDGNAMAATACPPCRAVASFVSTCSSGSSGHGSFFPRQPHDRISGYKTRSCQ